MSAPGYVLHLLSININCVFILQYLLIYIEHVTKLYLNFLAELGDYNLENHKTGYLSNMNLIPNQTIQLEHRISELHKLHK